MINFTLGALFSGILLITIYFTLFSKKKIINYKRKDQLARLISQQNFEFLLIDIRDEEDYNFSHIPTAVNIPYKKLISSLPVENMFLTIIVYGGSRKISRIATDSLSDSGYFNVTSFGSLSRWKGDLIRNEYIGDKHIENSREGRVNFPV
jgi:rhodanese-related sulfurtransferase